MDFDIVLPGSNRAPTFCPFAHTLDASGTRRILEVVDELDFRSVSVCEHLAMPRFEVPRLGSYWEDALSVMAFVAGATRRVRIDAAVLVAPLHHPLRLAKAVATIDVLSQGRVNLSVGVGHAEQEFAALGVPFGERGAITDEILSALLTLWTAERPEHTGKYFQVTDLAIEPTPAQKPHPPIYIGGNSKPALRRAARYEGWQPSPIGFTPQDIPPLLDYLRSQPAFAGKHDTFDVNWLTSPVAAELRTGFARASASELAGYREQLVDAYCGLYRAVGITRTAAQPPPTVSSEGEYVDYLRWFSEEVIPAVKAGWGGRPHSARRSVEDPACS